MWAHALREILSAPRCCTAFLLALAACGVAGDRGPETRGALPAVRLWAGDPEPFFPTVTSIDVDSEGQIYVARVNDRGGQVTVLGREGRVVRRLGGSGFKYVGGVRVLRGDSLHVFDEGLRNISVFAPGGHQAAYTVALGQRSAPTLFPYWAEPSGRRGLIVAAFRVASRSRGGEEEGEDVVRLLHRDGSILRDSILLVPGPERLELRAGTVSSVMKKPFGRRSVVASSPDGRIYQGWTGSREIRVFAWDGREEGVFRIGRTRDSRRVTAEDLDSAAASLANPFFKKETVLRSLKSKAPNRWPVYRDLVADDSGQLWVGLIDADRRRGVWAAYDRSGRWVRSVAFPESFALHAVRGGIAYGVDGDSPGAVATYRIAPPALVAATLSTRSRQ